MNQELVFQASMFKKQADEIKEKLEFIEKQSSELLDFNKGLGQFMENEESESLSALGKGVYVKTSIKEKKLLVNVGQNILVKKNPAEVREIIDNQLKRLNEAQMHLSSQLEIAETTIREIIKQIQKEQKENKDKK